MDDSDKKPEITAEEQGAFEEKRRSLQNFMADASMYCGKQIAMIDGGEIHISAKIMNGRIYSASFHSNCERGYPSGKKD